MERLLLHFLIIGNRHNIQSASRSYTKCMQLNSFTSGINTWNRKSLRLWSLSSCKWLTRVNKDQMACNFDECRDHSEGVLVRWRWSHHRQHREQDYLYRGRLPRLPHAPGLVRAAGGGRLQRHRLHRRVVLGWGTPTCHSSHDEATSQMPTISWIPYLNSHRKQNSPSVSGAHRKAYTDCKP
jgi:hypothetical protein